MSGISKRVSGSWVSGDYGIMKTATDTLTTLPAVLYPNDTTATVGLKGNTVQTGTPTPDSPIMPQSTGEMTGNLFDKDSNTINNNGQIRPGVDVPAGIYSISNGTPNWVYYRVGVQGTTRQISAGSNAENINASDTLYVWRDANIRQDGVMLNEGSTALPYEPYGYKIPISSASTTTPVYLGEVETTRRIRKLVLTGEETWTKGEYPISDSVYHFYMPNPTGIMGNLQSWIISHFVCGRLINGTAMGLFFNFYPQTSLLPENPTANDFKAWIAAQYAAGTPVTVWYVLATPETAVVNEPLMKIGEYADEVSTVSIPVTAGANTLSVDTTVQPSEVTVNYKGWHPVADVHEYDSNYTIATMQALTIAQLQSHTIGDLEGGEWS